MMRREQRDVDVAAADQQRRSSRACRCVLPLQQRGERRGAGAFGQRLLLLQQHQDGAGDLLLVDGDDLVHVALRPSGRCARRRAAPRCRRRWWPARASVTGCACFDARAAWRQPRGLHADDADVGTAISLMAQAMPPIRPPPPMGTTTASSREPAPAAPGRWCPARR